jgi:RNase P subunit RPR2
MRGDRWRQRDTDVYVDPEPRISRRKAESAPSVSSVRNEWEPTVCPECGTEHPDTSNVRVRRTGQDYEARCLACGTVAARYIGGIWSS